MPSLEELNDEQRLGYARIAHAGLTHSDPKIRRAAKLLVKSLNPQYADPELESESVEERLKETMVKPLQEQLKSMQDKIDEDKLNAEWNKTKERIEASGLKFDDVKNTMVERRIADADTAAEFLHMQNQMATPSTPNGQARQMAPDVQKLLGDKQGLINHRRTEAHKAIDELNAMKRTGVRPANYG